MSENRAIFSSSFVFENLGYYRLLALRHKSTKKYEEPTSYYESTWSIFSFSSAASKLIVLLQCYLAIAVVIHVWAGMIPCWAYLVIAFRLDEELVSWLLPHYTHGFSKEVICYANPASCAQSLLYQISFQYSYSTFRFVQLYMIWFFDSTFCLPFV